MWDPQEGYESAFSCVPFHFCRVDQAFPQISTFLLYVVYWLHVYWHFIDQRIQWRPRKWTGSKDFQKNRMFLDPEKYILFVCLKKKLFLSSSGFLMLLSDIIGICSAYWKFRIGKGGNWGCLFLLKKPLEVCFNIAHLFLACVIHMTEWRNLVKCLSILRRRI